MKPRAFLGPAGTGKTYELTEAARGFCASSMATDDQRVLALTFMHGARQRISQRLSVLREHGWRVDAETIDSFALRLVRRFRRAVRIDGLVRPAMTDESGWTNDDRAWRAPFSTIRSTAADLLKHPSVEACVAASYPLVVLDEIQDCRSELLDVLIALSSCSQVLCAGDEFQLLERDVADTPAVTWLAEAADVTLLSTVHRTDSEALINTASALRHGVRSQGCIAVEAVPAPGLGAWQIATRMAWKGWQGDVALISPARPKNSIFTRGVLGSLGKVLGKKTKVGPYPFTWEPSHEEAAEDVLSTVFDLLGDGVSFSREAIGASLNELEGTAARVLREAKRTILLRGDAHVERGELLEIAERFVHAARIRSRVLGSRRRRAMTVHGAKNREFEYVFILWPFEIAGEHDYRRRLLYNAVTRARTDAVVIVQGDEGRRAKDEVLGLIG